MTIAEENKNAHVKSTIEAFKRRRASGEAQPTGIRRGLSRGLLTTVPDELPTFESGESAPVAPSTPPLSSLAETEAQRAVDTSNALNARRDSMRDVNLDYNFGRPLSENPTDIDTFQFEGFRGPAAQAAKERFLENDPDAAFLQPETMVNPEEDSGDPWYTAKNITNFLFSDEMGLLGIKWDEEGATWAWDNFKTQLSEHPYSTALTLASYLVPVGAAWMKGARIAQRASKIAGAADGINDTNIVKIHGLFGTKGGREVAEYGGTLGAMKALGPRVRFDDHAKFVKALANSPDVNDGQKFFSPSRLEAIKNATDEEIAKLVPEKELRRMLVNDMHSERYLFLKNAAKKGEAMNPMRRAELKLWETFGNKYFQNTTDLAKDQIESMDDFFAKSGIGKWLATAPVIASKADQEVLYKFFAGKGTYDELVNAVGEETTLWADGLRNAWADLFEAQSKEGFLTDETIEFFNTNFGGVHLPAILEGTPGFLDFSTTAKYLKPIRGTSGDIIKSSGLDAAKVLNPATMMKRGKYINWEKIEPDLHKLVTEPRALTAGGFIRDNVIFQIHRGFRDMIADFTGGSPKMAQWLMPADEYDTIPLHAKKYWMSFDELDNVIPGLSNRMERMVRRKMKEDGKEFTGRLPVMDRNMVQDFFGKEKSAFQGAGAFGRLFELITSVHKTARTALNIPTHMNNLLGNFMFLAMAGMNPFSSQALNDGKLFTKAFTKLARQSTGDAGKTMDELLEFDNLAKIFGDDRYITDELGAKIDLAEIFSQPAFRNLIEAQSFEKTEGLQHTKNILKQMEALESSNWSDKAVTTVARAVAGIGEAPGIRSTLHAMSSAYLGEDMVPKMMYVSNLLRKGWGVDSIIKEVGRRLPQYATVGNLQQSTRRVILPWITFPTEAARIIKNNMMDSPVSMMAWMQAPAIAQSIATESGIGPDYSEIEHLIDGAQPWAERYQTVYLNEADAGPALGAVGGGTTLGFLGGAVGGAKGAAAGAALGTVGGAMLGAQSPTNKSLSQNDLASVARAWTLDFLPTSALTFSTTHPTEWAKLDPFNPDPVTGMEVARTAMDVNPIEPFAIAMPLIDLFSGKGSFGREIETKSGMEFANKMALGLFGFVMPPVVQKYGMKLESQGQGAYVPMADIFEANGGQMTLPKHLTATLGGLSTAGLTFLGARTGLGASKGAALGSALAAGIPGAMAGAEVNTRRLMTDLGIMHDPYTNKKGDWTMDFFFNSFMGANKSWRVGTGTAMDADSRREKRVSESRAITKNDFMDAARNGRESQVVAKAGEAYKSFLFQYANVDMAQTKYIEWLERNFKELRTTPQFRHISEEQLKAKIAQEIDFLKTENSRFHRQKLAEMETELQMRRLMKASKMKVVDVVPRSMRK